MAGAAGEHRPDVALLDIGMPGIDGLAAAGVLAQEFPECRSLILTTFGRPGYLRRAMESGAYGSWSRTRHPSRRAQPGRGRQDRRRTRLALRHSAPGPSGWRRLAAVTRLARVATVVTESDMKLADGRTLHCYDTGEKGNTRLAVFWHHGTPNTGAPPEPLFPAADRLGIRWVSYDRPGYGRSTPRPRRSVGSAAGDVESIANALGIRQFAVMGHSGGAAHALAGGALLPERVVATVGVATMAPFDAEGLDWFAGMAPSSEENLRAAAAGRAALENHQAAADFDPEVFTEADKAALSGPWSWLAGVAGQAIEGGPAGQIDDDLAYVAPWGFDPAQAVAPVLLMHGGQDRIAPSSHAEWLAGRCPSAQLRLYADDGHVSVLNSAVTALDWLSDQAGQG